jgi:hypothetical protein
MRAAAVVLQVLAKRRVVQQRDPHNADQDVGDLRW